MNDNQKRSVYFHFPDNIFRGPAMASLLTDNGYEVVDTPENADWAICSYGDKLPELIGKVPKILTSTIEVRPLYGRPNYEEVDGSRIWNRDLTTGHFNDLWRFFINFGATSPEFLPWDERESIPACIMAGNRSTIAKVPGDLTELRVQFVHKGIDEGLLDLYGSGWGDYQTFSKASNRFGENNIPWTEIKHETIKHYRVNFALENTYYPYYVTEKFWNAINAGCVPVYYGSAWLDDLVPSDYYLDLRRFPSIESLFDAILALTEREAYEMVTSALRHTHVIRNDNKNTVEIASREWRLKALSWMRYVDSFDDLDVGRYL